jgi:hypothetical protein
MSLHWLERLVVHPLGAGFMSGLLLVLASLGPVLAVVQVLVPLPLLLTAVRGGTAAWSAASGAFVAMVWAASGNVVFAAMAFLLLALAVPVGSSLLRARAPLSRCISVLYGLGVLVVVVCVVGFDVAGIDLTRTFAPRIQLVSDHVMASVTQVGQIDAVSLAGMKEQLDQFLAQLARFFPTIVVAGWFMIQAGNVMAALSLSDRWQWPTAGSVNDMVSWRVPFAAIWPLIVAFAGAVLLGESLLREVLLNLAGFLCIPYAIQGTVIIHVWCRHYRLPRVVWWAYMVVLGLWWEVLVLTTLIGLSETWFDLRGRLAGQGSRNRDGDGE